jgi:hypothetical protein
MKEVVCAVLLATLFYSIPVSVSAQKFKSPVVDAEGLIKRPLPVNKSLPVQLSKNRFDTVEAFTNGRGTWIRWRMESELKIYGFYVYRVDGKERQKVTDNPTLGTSRTSGQVAYGAEYVLFDAKGSDRSMYQVEIIPMEGTGQVSSTFQTRYVYDLASVGFDDKQIGLAKVNPAAAKVEQNALDPDTDLKAEISSSQQAADINKQRWLAAQASLKIGVKKDGVYRVTRAQLQAAGFDVTSDPSLWQLYRDGIQQSIIVEAAGNYIEFFGRGLDTPENDSSTYFLVVGSDAGLRIASRVARPSLGTALSRSYAQTFEKRERGDYFNDILNGDAENFFGSIPISTSPLTETFNISGVDTSIPTFTMEVDVQGYTLTAHPLSVTLNSQSIGSMNGSDRNPFSATFTLPISMLIEGANTLKLVSNAGSDISLFDRVKITYKRTYAATQNALIFNSQNYKVTKVGGFSSSSVRLFDITQDGAPVLVTGPTAVANGPSFTLTVPANRSRLFCAVETSGILQPASLELNTPSQLATGNHAADLVIISYKNFLTQANAWADYRRGQGFTVEVVDVSDIFDEFSYGVQSADSLKSFLQYAKTSWQVGPQYVLIIGDSSFDPRNYLGFGLTYLVPIKIVTTTLSETGSDDYAVDFDNDGLADLAIGRIPAVTSQNVIDALNNVMTFEQPAGQSMDRGILFAHDIDPFIDFAGMTDRMKAVLPAGVPTTTISRNDPNSEAAVVSAISSGKYAVNYSGHGSIGVWSSTAFFSAFNVDICNTVHPCISNAPNRSIFTMLTCLNGYFINPKGVSIAERLLTAPNGGAVSVWASTGLTTNDVQEVMGTRFYSQLGAGNIKRLGDLVLDAKSVIIQGIDVRLSWALLGDPMLKVHP